MSTMIPGEVLGLGMPLLFGIHRKIVSLCGFCKVYFIIIFREIGQKSLFSLANTHLWNEVFTMVIDRERDYFVSGMPLNTLELPNNHSIFGKTNSGD